MASLILLILIVFQCAVCAQIWDDVTVPHIPVREDTYTGKPVHRGRFDLIGGFPFKPFDPNRRKLTLKEFKRAMQCAPSEPGIFESGGYQLAKHVPMDKRAMEALCAWFETGCVPWAKCVSEAERLKTSTNRSDFEDLLYVGRGGQFQVKLFRFSKGKLFYDWPWGQERIKPAYNSVTLPFMYLATVISDLPDSAFFVGLERSLLPWNFPFIAFTNSPSKDSADLPLPWWKPFILELRAYSVAYQTKSDSSQVGNIFDNYAKAIEEFSEVYDWERKFPKAAFYGTLTEIRQVFFDIAGTRPDLFDIGWTSDYAFVHGRPWNPHSDEETCGGNCAEYNNTVDPKKNETGYLGHLFSSHLEQGIQFFPGRYKYLVVLTGLDGKAAADRLTLYLAHSRAVILLQDSVHIYHFSARLKPWVHYVPLSFSGADAIEKIEWLQTHDDIARRLAQNARSFAKSYLRLEDFMCYYVTSLEVIGKMQINSSTVDPFRPAPVEMESNVW